MVEHGNIPKKYINQLAKLNKIKFRSRESKEIIEDLIKINKKEQVIYLNEQFKFKGRNITLLEIESNFPEKCKTPEKFINILQREGNLPVFNKSISTELNSEWRPELSDEFKICALKHEGSSVYLKLVHKKYTTKYIDYDKILTYYPSFASIVVHFGSEEKIQFRCSNTDLKKYIEHMYKIMGITQETKFYTVPKLTKENAKRLCDLLSAGVASTHIAVPSTVGSIRFNGKKGINLTEDSTMSTIKDAIEKTGLPTDQTMDETCFFRFEDPTTSIVVEATFEVNIQKGVFKFTTDVPEVVIDHVLDALIRVNITEKALTQSAATKE
ncbi:hypothetical protein [Virgibacillus dokdonensis]|uniref:hypothetical protein n=1 Tax=Virgibacillus dokdonensis TaxID=302167 RepID=UPI00098A4988|nr:hypothetical protein [Virgibacillus dokdonensis]